MLAQGFADHLRRLLLQVDFRAPRHILGGHLEAAAVRGNDGHIIEQMGDGLYVESGRHHHQTQILAQIALAFDAQRQPPNRH